MGGVAWIQLRQSRAHQSPDPGADDPIGDVTLFGPVDGLSSRELHE
jgi:hypothetical protein